MEPNEQQVIEAQSARLGLFVIAAFVLVLPLVLAYLLAAWSLTFAAFDLMMAQFTG